MLHRLARRAPWFRLGRHALLTPQALTTAGLSPSLTAANSSDTVAISPGQKAFLYVLNGGGSSINVTISDPGLTPAGNAGTPVVVAVPNGTTPKLIPLVAGAVAPSTGLVTITYSAVTSVTAAVVIL